MATRTSPRPGTGTTDTDATDEETVMLTLTSLGAAGTVTGSKHLLEFEGRRVLVDCGQFQGVKNLRELNWSRCPSRRPA